MALAILDTEKNRIVLKTLWRERELCKQAGAKYDENIRDWTMPLSWASCVILRGVWGSDLEIDDRLNAWAAHELDTRIDPCLELRHAPEATTAVYRHDQLEPMQAVAVQFLATARRALCGDGMGSGKTIEAICAVEQMGDDAFPCLVVSTNTMVRKWVEELEIWSPHRTAVALKGTATQRRKLLESGADWYVINWEGLLGHSRLAGYGSIRLSEKDKTEKELNQIGIKTVIADEAHRGKNPMAKQTRAWWYLSHRADNSFALTGTPIVKHPGDLWSIMHGVAPTDFHSKTSFVDRYCLLSWGLWGGMDIVGLRGDTQDELFRFLDPRFIRRPTRVVVPNIAEKLPPQIREVDMTPKQEKAYKQMRDQMLAEIDNGLVVATNQLTKTTRLVLLASAFGELDADENFMLTDPSCKAEALMDVIEELDEEPLVVFAESRQLIELASRRLTRDKIEHGLITGKISEFERAQAVHRFQNDELQLMLCTLGAGGEGITLTKARHVLFLQRSWSLAKNMQATDRVWRRGQDRPVQPIIIVAKNTIESRVLALGEQRELTFEEVVRDQETLRKLLQ